MKKNSLFKKHPIIAVFFTVFVDLIGFGILIPIIPLILADPASSYYILPQGVSYSTGYLLFGLLVGIYSFMTFISAPIIGQLSDTYGRKKLLIISLAGTSIGYVLFALGIVFKNIPLLFIGRILDGITGGNISVAQAAIADTSSPKDRAKNFGLIGMAFGLGFVLGPYLGGKLSDPNILSFFNAATPFYFAAILSFLNVISVILFFPETLKEKAAKSKINFVKSINNITKAFTSPNLRIIFLVVFLFVSGFTFFTSFFSVFLIDRFNFSQGQIGDFFAYIGIWIAITQGIITRFISKHYKSKNIVKISLFGMGLALLLYFLPQKSWQLFIVAPFFAIFNGLVQANITAIVSNSVGNNMQGEILGINASVKALAQAIPPILSGIIAATLTPESPIFIASIIIIISGIFFLIQTKEGIKNEMVRTTR